MLAVLDLLHGFWAGTEPALDSWFTRHPEVAERLAWTRRARLHRLDADRAVLAELCDVPPAPAAVAPAVFADVDEAAVLGWLYVAEGSTLGGAVIDRLLRDAGLPCRLQSFRPYAEGPQPMWRAYLEQLQAWTVDSPARTGLVVAAGVQAFAALEQWTTAGSVAAA